MPLTVTGIETIELQDPRGVSQTPIASPTPPSAPSPLPGGFIPPGGRYRKPGGGDWNDDAWDDKERTKLVGRWTKGLSRAPEYRCEQENFGR